VVIKTLATHPNFIQRHYKGCNWGTSTVIVLWYQLVQSKVFCGVGLACVIIILIFLWSCHIAHTQQPNVLLHTLGYGLLGCGLYELCIYYLVPVTLLLWSQLLFDSYNIWHHCRHAFNHRGSILEPTEVVTKVAGIWHVLEVSEVAHVVMYL